MKGECDICGKTDVWLEPLTEAYRTEEIKDVCDSCLMEANRHLSKLQEMTAKMNKTWMKRFMESMKAKFKGA